MTGPAGPGPGALGPYFSVGTHEPGPVSAPWVPLAAMLGDPATFRGRVTATRSALADAAGRPPADVEVRVAVSVTQLGLVARLICPVLGVAVTTGRELRLDPAQVRWQPVLGGPFPLSVPRGASGPTWSPEVLLDGAVRALVELAAGSVSRTVLWGNVASAVHGAGAAVAAARPDLAGPAATVAAALLRHPALAGGWTGTPGGPGFRRRSCCLIYRIAPPGGPAAYCGDCILTSRGMGS